MRLFQARTKKRRNVQLEEKVGFVLRGGDLGAVEKILEDRGNCFDNFKGREENDVQQLFQQLLKLFRGMGEGRGRRRRRRRRRVGDRLFCQDGKSSNGGMEVGVTLYMKKERAIIIEGKVEMKRRRDKRTEPEALSEFGGGAEVIKVTRKLLLFFFESHFPEMFDHHVRS